MSKVICDVCGTTYPETASQCPICGCAKNNTAQTAAGAAGAGMGASSYNHVRGGRFSKSNVRKRSQRSAPASRRPASGGHPATKKAESENNRPLVIAIVLLLLAIVLVVAYMIINYFAKDTGSDKGGSGQQTSVTCTAITLSEDTISFNGMDCQWLLAVTKIPNNTTDKPTFTSSDESVATVSSEGLILPVGPGQAEITVKCGKAESKCTIVCDFSQPPVGGDTTEPPETTAPNPNIDPDFEFKFNTKYTDKQTGYADVSLTSDYRTWRAYRSDMTVSPSDITWISENEDVCIIENGIVTATGKGTTYIHAEYNGKRVSCVVRSTAEPLAETVTGNKLSTSDATLYLGTDKVAFSLTLSNSQGMNLPVTWVASEEGYVSIVGNRITGTASTLELKNKYVIVYCEYEGVKYECKVRVRPAEETQ